VAIKPPSNENNNMSNEVKVPWRKNLDKRYISGEDLLNGEAMGKGLRPEMVVTMAKFNDAPAFDQKTQTETTKTAIWLNEYPSGKPLYKPALLNVANGEFLSAEIGGGSIYITDFDHTKPFVIWAMPDRRHGHVARFKKYYAPATISDVNAISALNLCTNLDELGQTWATITAAEKKLPTVMALKEKLKGDLK
jgi:hypothetical protein